VCVCGLQKTDIETFLRTKKGVVYMNKDTLRPNFSTLVLLEVVRDGQQIIAG